MSADETRAVPAGAPIRITIPCAGLAPSEAVTVKVFDLHGLGGEPIETFDARVNARGDAAVGTWTYRHATYASKVSSSRFMLIVEAHGRVSASRPFEVVDTFEATVKAPDGSPAPHRYVVLHADRGPDVRTLTDGNGKVKHPVPPGRYHVSLAGTVPPEARIADHDPPPRAAQPARAAAMKPASPPSARWLEVELLDAAGRPLGGQRCLLELPGGEVREERLDANGILRVEGVPLGRFRVKFPDVDTSGASTGVASAADRASRPPATAPLLASVLFPPANAPELASGAEPQAPAPASASKSVALPPARGFAAGERVPLPEAGPR